MTPDKTYLAIVKPLAQILRTDGLRIIDGSLAIEPDGYPGCHFTEEMFPMCGIQIVVQQIDDLFYRVVGRCGWPDYRLHKDWLTNIYPEVPEIEHKVGNQYSVVYADGSKAMVTLINSRCGNWALCDFNRCRLVTAGVAVQGGENVAFNRLLQMAGIVTWKFVRRTDATDWRRVKCGTPVRIVGGTIRHFLMYDKEQDHVIVVADGLSPWTANPATRRNWQQFSPNKVELLTVTDSKEILDRWKR